MPDAEFDRWVSPDQLAGVIAFLLSPAATAITGALIPALPVVCKSQTACFFDKGEHGLVERIVGVAATMWWRAIDADIIGVWHQFQKLARRLFCDDPAAAAADQQGRDGQPRAAVSSVLGPSG